MSSAIDIRNDFRELLTNIRAIPGEFGLRPWRVFLATGSWSLPSHAGDGLESETRYELLENGQPPKVRQVTSKMVALGLADVGEWTVTNITPELGTPWVELLASLVSKGQTFRVVIEHDEDGESIEMVVKTGQRDKALHYNLTLSPIR